MATKRNGVPFELEDYVAVKQYAYDYVKNGGSRELKNIHKLVTENLNLPLDWIESEILISTILFPEDGEFCKKYKEELNNVMFYIDGNLISHACLETKIMEIKDFGLDNLIENGVLTPPVMAKNISNMSRK